MDDRRVNSALLASLAASLVLHATVLVPMWMLAMNTSSPASAVDGLSDTVESPDKQPDLGLVALNPSSLTWVGYDRYEEHIAALAEFEQAAFTEHPGDGDMDPLAPVADQPPVDSPLVMDQPVEGDGQSLHAMVAERAEAEPSEAEPNEASEAEASDADVQPQSPLEETPEQVLEALTPPAAPVEVVVVQPAVVPPDSSPGELSWVRALVELFEGLPTPSPGEPAAAPTERQSSSEGEAEPESTEAQQPATATSSGETPKPLSDRESDAFSTIDADSRHWRDGQPLAAHGIEVKPQKPHFTVLQRITASPGNPLVVIRFQADGTPASAEVRQSSGSVSVDASIESSLYRWRASGEAIEALGDEETFDVTIRIVLNPRAAAHEGEGGAE